MIKKLIFVSLLALAGCAIAVAQTFNPPIPTININGHLYSNANWQANFWGTAAAIANDIGFVTSQYPTGRFSPRVKLTSDLTMFVGGAGASDVNTCLSGNPCATPQHAYDLLYSGYDTAGFVATISIPNAGTYGSIKLRGRIVGQKSPAELILLGNPSSPGSVILLDATVPTNLYETGTGTAIYATWGSLLTVNGVKAVGGFRCIWANNTAEIRLLNVDVGSCISQLVASHAGMIKLRGNVSISGSTTRSAVLATDGGRMFLSDISAPEISPVISVASSLSCPIFAEVQRFGEIVSNASQTTYTGSLCTGNKYAASAIGLISTSSSGTGYFPATVDPGAGAITTNSVYQ